MQSRARSLSAYDGERSYPAIKNEPTGAVFCPQRLSSIAVMRCAEYQKEFGCGSRLLTTGAPCPNRAVADAVKALAQEVGGLQLYEPRFNASGGDPYKCRACCGDKKSPLSARCARCAKLGIKRGHYRKR